MLSHWFNSYLGVTLRHDYDVASSMPNLPKTKFFIKIQFSPVPKSVEGNKTYATKMDWSKIQTVKLH